MSREVIVSLSNLMHDIFKKNFHLNTTGTLSRLTSKVN